MPSIVVVERDPARREQLVHELRALGYSVGEKINGPQPLALVSESGADFIAAGELAIDLAGHRVIIDDRYLTLAPREFDLLLFLVRNQDRVFTRAQLLEQVWQQEEQVGLRTVDVNVRRLRSVLEPYGLASYIQTVRGSGYRFSLRKE